MAQYIVDITTRYKVEADSELEATIKAGIENGNVQLDQYGFRINNVMKGIYFVAQEESAELVDHSNDPTPYEDMASAQDIADEITRIMLKDEEGNLPTDDDILGKHFDELEKRIGRGEFE